MSDAEQIGDIAVNLIEPCRHEVTEVRYKTFSNRKKHLCTQCQVCFQMPEGTRWLPQEGVDMSSVKEFDSASAQRWIAQRSKAIRAKLQKEKLERHLEYERYIRESPEWWAIRAKVMKRDGNLCQGCLQQAASEVHHKNYLHLYDEILFDLVAVCRKCHNRIHEQIGAAQREEEPVPF